MTVDRRQLLKMGTAAAAMAGLAATRTDFAAAQDTVEIEYWHINTESFGLKAVQEIVRLFQEANPGITVTERFQTNSYTELMERTQTAMVAGTPPDVAQVGYPYLDYVTNNFPYASADQLVKDNGDDDFLANFEPNILSLGTVNGVLAGMPFALSNMVAYFNADILKEAGVDADNLPTTWDDWRTMGQQITDATGNPAFYIQVSDDNWATQTMIDSNGGSLVSCDSGQVKAGFNSPEAIEAIQFWADMVKDGIALNANADQGQQAFFGEKLAFAFMSIARRGNFETDTTFDLRAAAVPGFADLQPKLTCGGNCLFVFSQDEAKKAAAWEFVKFCCGPEAQTVWVKETGYLPTRSGLADDPNYLADVINGNAIQKVAVDQLPNVAPWTSFPGTNGLQVGSNLANAVEAVLSGSQSAEDALNAAAETSNQLLAGQTCK